MALRAWYGALLLGALLLLVPAAGLAQNPPPPPPSPRDTVPREAPRRGGAPKDTATFRVPPGTLPEDTFRTQRTDSIPADSARPAPLFPLYPEPDTAGYWRGTWVWTREDLLRFHGTSLLALVEGLPGVVVTRAGSFGRPTGVAPFGLGGGRTRVFVDGWEIDPLASATLDLQQIALFDLEEVRVERRLDELRIEITPFRVPDNRPFSGIEAATGEPETRFLRGVYAQTTGSRGLLTLGFGVTDTRGLVRAQRFASTNGFARWSWLFRPDAGVQLEYRLMTLERPDTFEAGSQSTFLVRGRMSPRPGLTLDAMAGRSWREPTGDQDRFDRSIAVDQLVARALFRRGGAWVEGSARLRSGSDDAFAVPTSDLSLRAGARLLPLVALEGRARAASAGGQAGAETRGTVRVGPFGGASLFASVAAGSRGIGYVRGDTVLVLRPAVADTPAVNDTIPLLATTSSELAALRAGAEWSGPGVLAGAALLRVAPDRVVPFGLALDYGIPPRETEAATGVEAYLSVPFRARALRFQGWFTYWAETGGRPYLPRDEGRASLEYHRLFYTGNLEPTFRVEAVRRGAALFPASRDGTRADASSSPYVLFNGFVQVRVIDVRIFGVFENLFNLRTAADVPGLRLPGARILYGVRWDFRN